jgi:Na+-driven multidrug efflux pump
VARFIVIFGLLIFPWPGWNEIYSGYFRALGQAVFSRQDDQRIVQFNPYQE